MYSNDRGFGLKDLIIKIIFLALFVLLMVWLFPKVPNMVPFYSNVFRENISYMQTASKSYFTTDKLPTETNGIVKLTLKEMQDLKLIIPFVDKDGNSCNLYESYSEVTKEENGYKLKVQLTCNTESDFIVEILGCYDYGCDTCKVEEESSEESSRPENQTAIEYEFSRQKSETTREWICPEGYERNNKICTKDLGDEVIDATPVYNDPIEIIVGALFTIIPGQRIPLEPSCVSTPHTSRTQLPTLSRDVTTGSCTYVEIPDPDCTVRCVPTLVNGQIVPVCNTCGTVTVEDCSGVSTTKEYYCPDGTDEREGTGANLKCYKVTTTTTTTCTCPEEADVTEGTGANVKCWKITDGSRTPYCENPQAVLDTTNNTCTLTIPGGFSHYKCPSNDYELNGKKCTRSRIDTVDAEEKINIRTWTEYKWSRLKYLLGWTRTGRTRIVNK